MGVSIRNRLLGGALALLIVVAGGSLGYWLIGDGAWPMRDCLYMTVITVTTVGYGEVLPGMDHTHYARGFTILLLVFGTGILVYFASTITAFVVEGDLNNLLRANRLRKRTDRMKNHVIVCGVGSTGRHIIEELVATQTPVVAIDTNRALLEELDDKYKGAQFSYVVADATADDALANAHVESARGVVAALASDKDNLYLVVSTRQANSTARIVARSAELSHVEKMRRAGADSVVSPNHIGGVRMASELLRPAVVRFLDEMLRDKRAAYRIEEIVIADGSTLAGKTLREVDVLGTFGMSVMALKPTGSDAFTYNPDLGQYVKAGATLVVLGSPEQVSRLRAAAMGAATAS